MDLLVTKINGVFVINHKKHIDNRGYFTRLWDVDMLKENGLQYNFVQVSLSYNTKGILRGLHYQKPPHEETKLVICVSGRLFDVVVDLRKDSPTYKKWLSFELSPKKSQTLYISKGIAHGYVALENNTLVVYASSTKYKQEFSCGIRWNDPTLKIKWPLKNPVLSKRDSSLPWFKFK